MAKRIVPLVVALTLVGYFGYRAWENKQAKAADDGFHGTVEAVEILVSPQLTGRIVDLEVGEGDRVMKDQLLARIDGTLYEAQLNQARSAVEAVESREQVLDANIKALKAKMERARRLYRAGAGPRMAYEDLAEQLAVLEAEKESLYDQVGQADAARKLAEEQASYTKVTAPAGGRVVRVHAEEGELAFPGAALLTIADLSEVEVRIYVPEPMLGRVKLGEKVELWTDSFSDRSFPAKVSYISDRAEFTPKNVQTREERVRLVYAVKVLAKNPDGVLKIGMPVDARFVKE